ncbi:MAG: HDIG domain-containing protein [Clostridiales bacterium]|nr:HDIG domain-containing protein [Clostridiales bacterium]
MADAEKQNEITHKQNAYAPPKSAYFWLAGIFAVVFAAIYIALVLFVHFVSTGEGILGINEAEAYTLYVFVFAFFLIALYIYIVLSRRELLFSLKRAGALMTVFTFVVVVNIVLIAFSPYLICVALTAMLVLPFSKKSDAFVLNAFSCWISSFVLIATLEISQFPAVAFTLLAGMICGAVATYTFPNNMTRVGAILRSFVACVSTVAVYFVLLSTYQLSFAPFIDNIMYIGVSVAGELLLSVVLVPVVEWIFNLTSDFRLMELTNHKAPLIKRLAEEAPGTFNHCLAVANFAEICAEAVGEDPYLARACAYYHDVGKLNNVEYFTENQAGYNPHDEILPEVSAEIIRNHTVDGYELCKQFRIPEEVARVAIEHHGTQPIMYFYNKAKSLTDGDVDMDEYRYYGEIPTGKIGAIIMICDSAEAAIRAMDNPTGDKVDKLLRSMIDERLKLGQFDNCAITMKDLTAIREAIVGAYGGLYHKRIKYNNGKNSGGAHV